MAQPSLFQLYDWKQAQPKSFIGPRAETRAGVWRWKGAKFFGQNRKENMVWRTFKIITQEGYF